MTDKLNAIELNTLCNAGITSVTYTDAGITEDTVTRLLLNDKGGHFVLRCNYLDDESIEVVSLERSKTIRINKGVVEDV